MITDISITLLLVLLIGSLFVFYTELLQLEKKQRQKAYGAVVICFIVYCTVLAYHLYFTLGGV